MSGSKQGEDRKRMKMREHEDRTLERTVWSLPGLSSDMIERRIAAKKSNAIYMETLRRVMGA